MSHDETAPHLTATSDSLASTRIAPALDAPLAPGQNTLFAGTFGLAWSALRDRAKGPVEIEGLPALSKALRETATLPGDVDEAAYVARAVTGPEGLSDLRRELSKKFGGAASPGLLPTSLAPEALLVYAYLFKNLALETPLARDDDGFERFMKQPVSWFGVWETTDLAVWEKRASQVIVHDHRSDEDFVIELVTKSEGDRLILARIPREPTLGQAITAALSRAPEQTSWLRRLVGSTRLGKREVMRAPILDFEVLHTYQEILGKRLSPLGLVVDDARQSIRLRLDERGALLKSEVALGAKKGGGPSLPPRMFLFEAPYLILMLRRGRTTPYLAMWVETAELMLPAKTR